MQNLAGWLEPTVVLLVLLLLSSIGLSITEAAPCGCSAEQQQASSLTSLVINGISNSSSSSSSKLATSTPTAPTASFIRIDDMLISTEDLQSPPAQSDGLGSAKASSSSGSSKPSSPSSYVSCRRLWPNGVLYYRFSSSFPSSYHSLVRQSLVNLEALVSSANNQKQLISFVEADFFIDVHYVNVINGDGCYSYIGKVSTGSSDKQDLSLEIPGCLSERIVQHEFMHALGFYHEHQRPDRDSYVTVRWSNIESDKCSNFLKYSYQLRSDYPRYDYYSVMHYRSDSFGCSSGQLTIVTTDGSSIEAINTSSLDISKLSYTYSSKNFAYCNSATKSAFDFTFRLRLLWMAQVLIVTVFVLSI